MKLHRFFTSARLRTQGVTLIELLTVVAIVAVLAAIGVPSFQQSILRNRMAAHSNEFLTTLNFARSEAIKRGHSVTLCPSSDGSACSESGWEVGWLAFADTNGNSAINGSETIIRIWPALSPDFTLRSNANIASRIRYDSRGMARNTGHLLLCKSGQINGARAIVVVPARPRVSYSGDKTAPINDAGTSHTTCTP